MPRDGYRTRDGGGPRDGPGARTRVPHGYGPGHGAAEEAVDPDVDLHVPEQRAETAGGRAWPVLAAIACGGALGAAARHGLALVFPAPPDGFPWAVLLANAVGCALIGVLMVLVSEGGRTSPHALLRPFLGVGVLGGFTTFSTYAVDIARLLDEDAPGTAMAYLGGTLAAALGAVALGARATRALVRRGGGERG